MLAILPTTPRRRDRISRTTRIFSSSCDLLNPTLVLYMKGKNVFHFPSLLQRQAGTLSLRQMFIRKPFYRGNSLCRFSKHSSFYRGYFQFVLEVVVRNRSSGSSRWLLTAYTKTVERRHIYIHILVFISSPPWRCVIRKGRFRV